MFNAYVVEDSYNLYTNDRVTSIVVVYPRSILSEFNTHTIISKNTKSSRAVPYARKEGTLRKPWQPRTMREEVMERPYIPIHFGCNQPGMQPGDELPPELIDKSIKEILEGRDQMVALADKLWLNGMHKGDVNRYIEPWAWTAQILTATQWSNFFSLRTPEPPHPAMKRIARMMYLAYKKSQPKPLRYSDWHLPFIDDDDRSNHPIDILKKLSVARSARLSYTSFTTGKREPVADLELFSNLQIEGHWSPFGHQCRPSVQGDKISNLKGMFQYRKEFVNECVENFTVEDSRLAIWQKEVEQPTYGQEYYV